MITSLDFYWPRLLIATSHDFDKPLLLTYVLQYIHTSPLILLTMLSSSNLRTYPIYLRKTFAVSLFRCCLPRWLYTSLSSICSHYPLYMPKPLNVLYFCYCVLKPHRLQYSVLCDNHTLLIYLRVLLNTVSTNV